MTLRVLLLLTPVPVIVFAPLGVTARGVPGVTAKTEVTRRVQSPK